jgi:hypothetical protein
MLLIIGFLPLDFAESFLYFGEFFCKGEQKYENSLICSPPRARFLDDVIIAFAKNLSKSSSKNIFEVKIALGDP